MTEKHFTDKDFQVAPPGWRAFWARAVEGGEVYVSEFPLVGWMTQTTDDGEFRVLPVIIWGGTAEPLGRRSDGTDVVRVVGPGQPGPDEETLRDAVRLNVLGDARWEAKR